MNEKDFKDIKERLEKKFYLKSCIKGNKLCFDEFNGYIVDDEEYEKVENLCESICDLIQEDYDCFCDYSILDSGYEFVIEII